MSIGQRISKLRKDKGYSQEYVAEQLNVSRQAVSKWETDASAPDTYNLIALAEIFNVSVEYIAIGKQEEKSQTNIANTTSSVTVTTQKILGFIFLGTGLLSLILGILLSELLLVLSFFMIAFGILALTVRKRLWFVSMWALWGIMLLLFMGTARFSLFCIFMPSFYSGGLSIWMIVSYLFWLWLIIAITVSVILKIKKNK